MKRNNLKFTVNELEKNKHKYSLFRFNEFTKVETDYCVLLFNNSNELQILFNRITNEFTSVFEETDQNGRSAILKDQFRAYDTMARLLAPRNIDGARHYEAQAQNCLALFYKEEQNLTKTFYSDFYKKAA